MKIYRKNVSDEEVQSIMAPHLAELMRHVVPRAKPEPEADPKQSPNEKAKVELTPEERDLLEDILEKPNLSVTTRAARLGLSAYKMNTIKASAIKRGFAEQFSINLGKKFGGTISLLALTTEGYKVLGKKPIMRPENVGLDHWWWQVAICDYFTKKNVNAEIEKSKNGIRVDICLTTGGREIAIEVELSPKNAVPNIVHDLEAGFDKVECCCKDGTVAEEVKRRLQVYEGYGNIKDRVEVRILTELQLVKQMQKN